MSILEAICKSGSTWSAYRYHDGELIWGELSFSNNRVIYRDARGYEHGQPVYPSPEKWQDKHDWKPFVKLQPLPSKI